MQGGRVNMEQRRKGEKRSEGGEEEGRKTSSMSTF
jgi:hypothetical protein